MHLASKRNTRKTIEEWVGEGIRVELAPLTKTSVGSKQIEITLRPWVYIYNLIAHILRQLTELKEHNLFVYYAFIPDNEIVVTMDIKVFK